MNGAGYQLMQASRKTYVQESAYGPCVKHQPTTRDCTVLYTVHVRLWLVRPFVHTILVIAVALHIGCFLFLPSENFSLWTTNL